MNADDTLLYMHSLHLACFLLEEYGCKLSVTTANFALWDFSSSSSSKPSVHKMCQYRGFASNINTISENSQSQINWRRVG